MYEKPYHQSYNTTSGLLLKTRTFSLARSYMHYHRTFELACALKGDITYVIRNQKHILKEGHFVLILPYQIHDYIGEPNTKCLIVNFSPNLVKHFNKNFSGKHSVSPVFRPSPEAWMLLKRCINEEFPSPSDVSIMTVEQECAVKSTLYLICSEYINSAEAVECVEETDTLAFKILEYISQRFTDDISLQSVATACGYNYHYLSKVFNKAFGYSFKTMLNHYRLAYAEQLLKESNLPITRICFECGFQSMSYFYRVFKQKNAETPNTFRQSYK